VFSEDKKNTHFFFIDFFNFFRLPKKLKCFFGIEKVGNNNKNNMVLETFDAYEIDTLIERLSSHRLIEKLNEDEEKAENMFEMIMMTADYNDNLYSRWDFISVLNVASKVLNFYDIFNFENIKKYVKDWAILLTFNEEKDIMYHDTDYDVSYIYKYNRNDNLFEYN
jgi:hypothetical protein